MAEATTITTSMRREDAGGIARGIQQHGANSSAMIMTTSQRNQEFLSAAVNGVWYELLARYLKIRTDDVRGVSDFGSDLGTKCSKWSGF